MFRRDKQRYVPYAAHTSRREGTLRAGRDKFNCPRFNIRRKELLKDSKLVNKLRFPEVSDRSIDHNMHEWCDFHQIKGHAISNCFTWGGNLPNWPKKGIGLLFRFILEKQKVGSMPLSCSENEKYE